MKRYFLLLFFTLTAYCANNTLHIHKTTHRTPRPQSPRKKRRTQQQINHMPLPDSLDHLVHQMDQSFRLHSSRNNLNRKVEECERRKKTDQPLRRQLANAKKTLEAKTAHALDEYQNTMTSPTYGKQKKQQFLKTGKVIAWH